jgi:hypothetical protein
MIRAKDSCVIFDVDALEGKDLSFENKATVKRRCGVSFGADVSFFLASLNIYSNVMCEFLGTCCHLLE